MPLEFSIPIEDVVDLLGLERNPKYVKGAGNFNVKCPFCGDKKYHLNINVSKNTYRCTRCSGDSVNLGVLDLYGRVRFNTPLIPGENSKQLYIQLKEELQSIQQGYITVERNSLKEMHEIFPAEDAKLDEVYTALLNLTYFRLSDEHRQNLINRGLDNLDIAVNKYASIRPPKVWVTDHPKYYYMKDIADKNELFAIRKNFGRISTLSELSIIGGMIVADDIISKGIKTEKIPGFFNLNGIPVFLMHPGMIIPTRNINREIVGLQVRADNAKKSGPRYLTVSSKGLDGGPTVNISRIHFPIANSTIEKDTRILVTEGPLKADVAVKLMEDESAFIALQGVDNVKEIPQIAELIKHKNVDTVYNAFDMDKYTNLNVAKAGVRLTKKFAKEGIRVNHLAWDYKYAVQREEILKRICLQNDIYWKEHNQIFFNLAANIKELENNGIDCSITTDEDGIAISKWNPITKGIDDFLLLKSKNRY